MRHIDEDMQTFSTIMKVKNKVRSFLNLFGEINENMLLPNIGHLNMFREHIEDVMNSGGIPSMISATYGTWIHHAQDQSWSARPLKPNIRFANSQTILYWESHKSSI